MCIYEGREGVKWELGFALFRGWEVGFCALPLGCLLYTSPSPRDA